MTLLSHPLRWYWPGLLTRRRLAVTPLCDWGWIGFTEVAGKGPRSRWACTRCDKTVVVIEPVDGEPLAYSCKTPFMWPLRKKVRDE